MSDFNIVPNTELAKAFKAYALNPENMKKLTKQEEVSVFNFLGDKYKNATPEQKPEIYQKGLLEFAAGQIALSDKNGDKAIDYKEYEAEQLAAYKDVYGEEASTEPRSLKDEMLEGFKPKDANKDGIVSKEEYVNAETKTELEKRAKIVAMDVNGDGKLSEEEFEQAQAKPTLDIKPLDPATEKILKDSYDTLHAENFKNLDANGDGKLSEEEFITAQSALYEKTFKKKPDFTPVDLGGAFKTIFSNQDLNGDGKLTSDEIGAGIAYEDQGEDGRLNGEIGYKDAVGTPWEKDGMKEALKGVHKFIFGN